MKRIFFILLLLMHISKANSKDISLCFTDLCPLADISICFTDIATLADICVWIGNSSFTKVDVCFTKHQTSNSINIKLVNSSVLADKTIGFTSLATIADKTICITNTAGIADVCIGIYDYPTPFTKEIYVRDINPGTLSKEAKVAILYALGMINK